MYLHAYIMKTNTKEFEKGQLVFKYKYNHGFSHIKMYVIGIYKSNYEFITGWVTTEGCKKHINAKYVGIKKIIGRDRKLLFLYNIHYKYCKHYCPNIGLIAVDTYSTSRLIKYAKIKRNNYNKRQKKEKERREKLKIAQNLLADKWRESNPEHKMSVKELKQLPYLRR